MQANKKMIDEFWHPFSGGFKASLTALFERADLFGVSLDEVRAMHEEIMATMIDAVKQDGLDTRIGMDAKRADKRTVMRAGLLTGSRPNKKYSGKLVRCSKCGGAALRVEVNTGPGNQTGDDTKWAIVCRNVRQCGYTEYVR
jgi:hypothetical protein